MASGSELLSRTSLFHSKLTLPDYLVLAGMLLISVGIGIYHALSGGRQRTTSEFLLADRTVHPIIAAISLVATFISGLTMLGVPAEMYMYGTMYWYYAVSYIVCGFITCTVFIPVFMELQLTSVYEYLEMRFNRVARVCGFTVFAGTMVKDDDLKEEIKEHVLLFGGSFIVHAGMVLYAPALALNAVTGISLWGSVLACGIVCIFYTSIGGLWAVLWTDVFQVMVMVAAIISVIIAGCIRLGGFDNMWRIADEGGRLIFSDFRLDPSIRHTFWSIAIGAGFIWTANFNTNQANLQRWLAVGTKRNAQITIVFTIIGMIILVSSACLSGLTLYAYYAGCDLLQLHLVQKPDQMLVYFIMELFEGTPGLTGFFISGVFSAAISTLSSALNALVAVTIEDVIKLTWSDISDYRLTIISKCLVLVYGSIVMVIAYLVSLGSEEILELSLVLLGMLLGPLLGVYSLGILFPWPNAKGAICGLVVSIALNLWIGIGALIYPPYVQELPLSTDRCSNSTIPWQETTTEMYIHNSTDDSHEYGFPLATLYSVSYAYYSVIGWLCTIIVGFIISFLTGANKSRDIDPSLMAPFVNKIYSLGCFDSNLSCNPEGNQGYKQHNEEEALELHAKDVNGYASIN